MFSIDLKAPRLIGEGHCNTQLRGRCVCVFLPADTLWRCGDNNTITHCSWNISLLRDHELYRWRELECSFAPALLLIAVSVEGGAERAIDLCLLPCCLDSCYQKLNNRSNGAWGFLLGVENHKQAIIYECLHSKVTWQYSMRRVCVWKGKTVCLQLNHGRHKFEWLWIYFCLSQYNQRKCQKTLKESTD